MQKGTVRKRILSLEELASMRQPNKNRFFIDNLPTYLGKKRESVFARDGYCCRRCGIKVAFAAQERSATATRWHINFYASVNGGERLMTLDHVIPRARGGSNDKDNLQVLCEKCNRKKGSKMPEMARGDRCSHEHTKMSNSNELKQKSLRSVAFLSHDLGELAHCNSLLMQSASMLS